MSVQLDHTERTATRRPGLAFRWFLSSALLGLLIGLVEASLLWTTPRVIPLLVPDVGWVIRFLAPLVDMTFFALVGLGLDFLARLGLRKDVVLSLQNLFVFAFVVVMPTVQSPNWIRRRHAQ
jgi:hypothetical protein